MQEQIIKFLMGLIQNPEQAAAVISIIERVLGLIEKYPNAVAVIAGLFGIKPRP